MKNILSDIFQRTLASLGGETHVCLRLDHISPVEDQQSLKAPTGTALILGLDDTKLEPVALFCITAPTLSPDHSGLLAMIVRRAQAHKAPYFITWTLRDAVLWKTPKPGTPAQRSHLTHHVRGRDDGVEIKPSPLDLLYELRAHVVGTRVLGFLLLLPLGYDQNPDGPTRSVG